MKEGEKAKGNSTFFDSIKLVPRQGTLLSKTICWVGSSCWPCISMENIALYPGGHHICTSLFRSTVAARLISRSQAYLFPGSWHFSTVSERIRTRPARWFWLANPSIVVPPIRMPLKPLTKRRRPSARPTVSPVISGTLIE
jgi:hypothetical protein